MAIPPFKVFTRLVRQSAIPFLIALVYAWWDYASTPVASQTRSGFVKSFGVAFFFVMWFVGLWFRTDKKISDDEKLSDIKADVQDIKDAIAQKTHIQFATARQLPVRDFVARTLLSEAEAAIDAGLNRSALVMAAVTLEHVLRQFAQRKNLPEASHLPIPKILSRLREVLGPAVTDDLYGLWRARNNIVHGREGELIDSKSANRLYDSFRWAVGFLSEGEDT